MLGEVIVDIEGVIAESLQNLDEGWDGKQLDEVKVYQGPTKLSSIKNKDRVGKPFLDDKGEEVPASVSINKGGWMFASEDGAGGVEISILDAGNLVKVSLNQDELRALKKYF